MPSPAILEKQKVVPMIFRRHGDTAPKNRGHVLGNAKSATFYIRELERQGYTGGTELLDPSVVLATRPFNPKFIANDKKVLRFEAYFLEAVHESNLENYRVRRCEVLYYLEDDTLQITEPKVENSGILQGNFVKRHRIPMPESDDRGNMQFFALHHLNVGEELTFYGRTFHLYSADEFTRNYLVSHDVQVPPDEAVPRDPYTVIRQAHMARETGQDPDAHYGKKKYPMKDFMEASLGKFARPSDNLRRFLAHDREVLRFFAIWDDTEKLYGICHRYTLHFFLADNTIEILESYERNSGCDPFPKLLNRAKLSKDPERQACAAVCEEGVDGEDVTPVAQHNCYSWEDLAIGEYLQIYNRRILLLDADESTRAWYEKHSMRLAPAIVVKKEVSPPSVFTPPVHDGLGSEEDSLQSCYHLLPKAPLKSIESLDTTEVLRFRARFETDQPEDVARRFVISVIVSDQSVSIIEFIQRNSGIVGGKFLERTRIKRTRPDGSVEMTDSRAAWLGLDDFYVGARVRMTGRTFVLFEMDEYSAKYMEARPAKFARSDKLAVLRKVRDQADKSTLLSSLNQLQQQKNQLDVEELASFLNDFVPDFAPHDAFTIIRNYGDKATMMINLDVLPQLLTE
ncbi:EF-hand domain-containing family member C2 [Phytophthora citrophthora]|uniref:EF-hand domain-containing family member C2 n=1 Tax=Phytophthora citrophthora TaxID=4793 RepID=A0AAD9GGA1_9STRA|nr:EF-hand domain-containing family member C2 [Phytophthora citrophthora]